MPKCHWILDAGHGSLTRGKRSPIITDQQRIDDWGVRKTLINGRFMEYEFNRNIVSRISKMLSMDGIEHTILVPEVNVGDIINERVKRANAIKSKLPLMFVSIHSNAAPAINLDNWGNGRGIEVLYYSDRNSNFATTFLNHLVSHTRMVNRGIKLRKDLGVLRGTKMPAILTESGFFNHPDEVFYLLSERGRDAIAKAHYHTIKQLEF